jgi:hypothetical protein
MGKFSGVCSRNFHIFLHLNDRSTTPWVYDKANADMHHTIVVRLNHTHLSI